MEQKQLFSIRLYLVPGKSGVYTVTSPDVPRLVTVYMPQEITANVEEAPAAFRLPGPN